MASLSAETTVFPSSSSTSNVNLSPASRSLPSSVFVPANVILPVASYLFVIVLESGEYFTVVSSLPPPALCTSTVAVISPLLVQEVPNPDVSLIVYVYVLPSSFIPYLISPNLAVPGSERVTVSPPASGIGASPSPVRVNVTVLPVGHSLLAASFFSASSSTLPSASYVLVILSLLGEYLTCVAIVPLPLSVNSTVAFTTPLFVQPAPKPDVSVIVYSYGDPLRSASVYLISPNDPLPAAVSVTVSPPAAGIGAFLPVSVNVILPPSGQSAPSTAFSISRTAFPSALYLLAIVTSLMNGSEIVWPAY